MGMLAQIGNVLQTAGVGTSGTDLFYGIMPPLPDACVALFAYAGKPPLRIPYVERPGVQVIIRGAKGGYYAAETKAQLVFTTLNNKRSFSVSSTKYKIIEAAGSVANMGYDEAERPLFVINFYVTKDI